MSGIVVSMIGMQTKQPNSGIRKGVKVRLTSTGEVVNAFIPGDGGLNYISACDQVHLAGLGNKGKAKGDLVGMKYQVIKVKGVSLKSLY